METMKRKSVNSSKRIIEYPKITVKVTYLKISQPLDALD